LLPFAGVVVSAGSWFGDLRGLLSFRVLGEVIQ
jgi:hypothetical protein